MPKLVLNPITGQFDEVNIHQDFDGDFVNVTGDTMTGALNIDTGSGNEALRLKDGTSTKLALKYTSNSATVDVPSPEPSNNFTNPDFETDITGWTQTSETISGDVFPDTGFLAASGAVAAWPLDDTVVTQSYSRVVNSGVSTGRNIVINGTFDADASWTKGTGWTIANGVASHTAVSSNLSQAASLVIGKTYKVTFTISNWSAGLVKPLMGSGTAGTNQGANGTFTENLICSGDTTFYMQGNSTFVGDIDNVIVQQVNIPPSSGTATNLLVDGDMEASGTSAWAAGNFGALSKVTGTSHGGSWDLKVLENGTSNPYARQTILTIGQVYRVSGYTRSDGGSTPKVLANGSAQFTGTTSTAWQPFDFVIVATATTVDLQAFTSVIGQYAEFDDVVVSLDNYIRPGELLQDGNMEASGTVYWATVNGTPSKETGTPHGGTQVLRSTFVSSANMQLTQSNVFVIGKTYRITGYARSSTANTIVPRVTVGVSQVAWTGTHSTDATWQLFDATIVATATSFNPGGNNAASGDYTEFDDVSVTEVDPLVGIPTNGVTLGSASGGHLTNAYTFDGTNDNVNIYSSDLNSTFNPSEGTLVAWAKYTGSWGDSNYHVLFMLTDGISNTVQLSKNNSANGFFVQYNANGTQKRIDNTSFSPSGWFQAVITWSKSADQVKMYLNGSQSGSTLTGLGTWNANISSTKTVIGANDTSGTYSWSGMINDVELFNRALSSTEVASLYAGTFYAGTTVTRDTGTKHAGVASMKVSTDANHAMKITQAINLGDTSSYILSCYAYTTGAAVTSSDVQLWVDSAVVATTYTSVGSGWYLLTATINGTASSIAYGARVVQNKTVYLDDFTLQGAVGADRVIHFLNSGTGQLTTDFESTITVNTGVSTAKGLIVKGSVAQTGNLQEWQNSSGTALASIDKSGIATFADIVNFYSLHRAAIYEGEIITNSGEVIWI